MKINKNEYPKERKHKSEKLTVEQFNKKYSTTMSVLKALLYDFRISEYGNCFNPYCPPKPKPIKEYYRPIHNRTAFICRNCLHHFYPMVDSIMNKSHILPEHWFQIMFLMLASRNSISCREVGRHYGYHPAAVFRMMHAVRKQMGKCLSFSFHDAVIEVDGSGVKTGKKGYGKHFKFKKGRGSQRNRNVLIIRERGGKMKLYVIHSEESESVLDIIRKDVDASCIIVTDDLAVYSKLKDEYADHLVINHSRTDSKPRRWKDGSASTNNAEGLFSLLKRNIKGTHIHVSDSYLENYLNELAFRITFRNEDDYGFKELIKSFGSLTKHYTEIFNQKGRAA